MCSILYFISNLRTRVHQETCDSVPRHTRVEGSNRPHEHHWHDFYISAQSKIPTMNSNENRERECVSMCGKVMCCDSFFLFVLHNHPPILLLPHPGSSSRTSSVRKIPYLIRQNTERMTNLAFASPSPAPNDVLYISASYIRVIVYH